jgi:glycosyltransferase involved in cell wall biosynthesis
MIVCVLGLRGFPRVMGGVETHCENLYPLLKRLRPNDSFTIIGRKGYLPDHISEYQGLWIVSLGHARGKHFEAITNAAYGALYARFVVHAELLHLHGIGPALIAPLARCLGMKVIITYHSKNYEHRKWNWIGRGALRVGELCAVLFGDKIITVSASLATDLKRRFPHAADKIYFIPNGADHLLRRTPRLKGQEVLSKYNLVKQGYIVAIGRLVPEKGFHDLVDAFKLARLDCKLVIVGAADHRDNYARRLLAEASENVVFTGFLNGDALQEILRNASLFVLPSHNEGLPIAALEAAALGVPVLLSDIQQNRDLDLNENNYFKVGDIDQLRSRLQQDHASFAVPRDAILQRYNWNNVCAETDKVYASVCIPVRDYKSAHASG